MSPLRESLTLLVEMQAACGFPAVRERFVLRNGTEWLGAKYRGHRRKAKQCFSNSTEITAKRGLTYVEGFAMNLGIGIPLHHAWNLGKNGEVQDSTWRDPLQCLYFGVTFALDEIYGELNSNGYYGLLDGATPFPGIAFMIRRDPGLRAEIEPLPASGSLIS